MSSQNSQAQNPQMDMDIMEVKKSLYDKVVAQPRLFEGEMQLTQKKKQSSDIQSQINEQKYRQFMDRAFMEMEKTNQQLQATRQELQQAGKNLTAKDSQISQLQAEMQRIQAQYQRQADDANQQMADQLRRREQDLLRDYEEMVRQKEEELARQQQLAAQELETAQRLAKLDAPLDHENFSIAHLTPRARQKLIDQFNDELRNKQQNELKMQQFKLFPRTYGEVVDIIRFDEIKEEGHLNVNYGEKVFEQFETIGRTFDFLEADKVELPENIQQYYHIKDLELELIQQEDLFSKVNNIKVTMMKRRDSNIEEGSEVSHHGHGALENISNV